MCAMAKPSAPRLLIAVLGVTEVVQVVGGTRRAHPVTQVQARLLARLAVQSSPVEILDLAAAVWGADPPRTARASLANHVSRLRAQYGERLVATTSTGYRLGVPSDVGVVAELVELAEASLTAGDAGAARASADEALTWQRGEPYADLRDGLFPVAAARYADELLIAAETLRLSSSLHGGWTAWSVAEAERLVAAAPYDEQRWSLLARALDDAGRRGDALGVLERARRTLREELGLDPGPLLTATDEQLRSVGSPHPSASNDLCLGRDAALAELLRLCGSSDLVLVDSEDGGGATTVLKELVRRLRTRGHTVAMVTCTSTPDQPLTELVALAEGLAGAVPTPIQSLTDAFVSYVARLGGSRPVTLVVDDLHHVGPSTLSALTRAAAQPGVNLVASARQPFVDGDLSGWARVGLGPLDARTIAAVVDRYRSAAPSTAAAEVGWYQQMSGGNAAFLTMLLESPAGPDVSAVGTLGDLVRSRTMRLAAATRLAVEVAAVAGSGTPEAVVVEFSSAEGVAGALAADVLHRHDGTLWFRHGVLEHVLVREVATGRRVELRQAVGERLLDLGHAPAAAEHLLAAAELAPAGAIAAAAAAAADAARHGAHLDAARWYERGLEVARRQPTQPQVALELRVAHGNELRLAGHPGHVDVLVAAFEEAVALGTADLVADAAAAVLALGTTTESGQPHERTAQLLTQALEVVDDREARARIRGAGSLALSMVGDPARSLQLFDEAERDAVSSEVRRAVLPYAYMAIGTPDQLPRRDRLARELLELAEVAADPVAEFEAHQLLFSSALQHSDGAAVRVHVHRLRVLVDQVGDIGRRWAALYASAALAHLEGDLSLAEQLNDDAFTTFAPVSASRAFAVYGGQLLALRLAQGRLPELVDSLEELVRDQPGVPAWRAAASLALVDSDPARAARWAELALDAPPQDFFWLASRLIGGRAAAFVGSSAVASAYLDQLAPWSGLTCWQGTCSYGPVDTTLALLHRSLGDPSAARHHAGLARDLARRLGAPVFLSDLDALDL
jgi:DNA-binding SARP family transcriptional activator/tetratricopeptide (TPR) repeat protein